MTENGWCTWERNADGALLPTAGGSVTPEEPDYFAGGDGSFGDPYQIATEAQLRAFAEATQAREARDDERLLRPDGRHRPER